ncbi:MAG: RNA-splicing ligase RtcB [Methanobacteriota archaeon]|nr:MAG: RNA-splicing ligase RtcB [Euryarchaeota archaeon]|tara:strand:+ start:3017 stop:4483 length:1467 start_codon:yes stop_codon:yes gene_type:complete
MDDHTWRDYMERKSNSIMKMKKHGLMKVDANLISNESHWNLHSDDRGPEQLRNMACLPGLVGDVWAMADWHFGYGFPIGGVAATDVDNGGVISPGGVGFDINCGVRLVTTNLQLNDIGNLKSLGKRLAKEIPAGTSGKGGYEINSSKLSNIITGGAEAAYELGWGHSEDLSAIESNGVLEVDEPNISERAIERGIRQLGTLGSGNHFLELQTVDSIVDKNTAEGYGLFPNQIVAMIHTGSRGLGHQVCSDHVKKLESGYKRDGKNWIHKEWGITLPDRQLAAAPIHSKSGIEYIQAMQSAGNFAFANRSALTQRFRDIIYKELGSDAEVDVLYDVSHNIAKFEKHVIEGVACNCCVHRKGATRALPVGHKELDQRFSQFGQPVLVPGDMGTASWVLSGPKKANVAFDSSCHGAGRSLSRTQARKNINSSDLLKELNHKGILIHAKTENVLSEEAPDAYKDVDEIIRMTEDAGLANPVSRLTPLIVIKG